MSDFTEKKLNIGIVCYPSVGGSGIVATQLGSGLAELGHDVHFISYDPPFRLNIKQPNISFHQVELNAYELFKFPDYTLPLAVKIVEVANKFKLDILHVHYAVPHATAALLAKSIANEQKIRFPHIITTLHGTDITLLGRDKNLMPVIKYGIEASCGVTAVSQNLKEDTEEVLKSNKKIDVIYNFYKLILPSRNKLEARESLGIKESDFLLLHMSNLRKVKRIPDLFEIMSKLKNQPNIKMLILAGGNFDQYQDQVEKLGMERQVIIVNNVLDIENYIVAADLGVYTSEEESFGMGILETMSYGKAVLATNIGGIPEVMVDGETGFLFAVGDTSGFAEKIIELAENKSVLQKLGENAQKRAEDKFSQEVVVKQYLEYYKKIMIECN
ncbi:MAG: N-acetyl-alpha-D-glucosaminyl L-malate synthase BshA [Candidatus Paceibacterota bacterium]